MLALSEQGAGELIERVQASSQGEALAAFDCQTMGQFEARAEEIATRTGVQIGWVARACDVQTIAGLNLGEIRSEAEVDWLKKEVTASKAVNIKN